MTVDGLGGGSISSGRAKIGAFRACSGGFRVARGVTEGRFGLRGEKTPDFERGDRVVLLADGFAGG